MAVQLSRSQLTRVLLVVGSVGGRMRSRVAGLRLTLSLGFSSAAVWALGVLGALGPLGLLGPLGPLVKANGIGARLLAMAGISACTALALPALPDDGLTVPAGGKPASPGPADAAARPV